MRKTFSTKPSQSSRPPHFRITEEILSPTCSQGEIADALRPHHEAQTPVVLRGPMAKTDPIYLWTSLEYLRHAIGENTPCNVEIGRSYADPNLQRPEISFGDYLQYLQLFKEKFAEDDEQKEPPPNELVYLAQNDLFVGLRNDVSIPDLCQDASFGIGSGRLYGVNFWFGPRGCVSPLHYDPLDNLLMQFVGKKRVLLFPRTEMPGENHRQRVGWYYAGADGGQYNTSAVDVEDPNIDRYPLFSQAPAAIECLLTPGDVLFIPKKWWHHVRSLNTSASVNAWWR